MKLNTFSQIRNIADPAIRKIVIDYLTEKGISVGNRTGNLPSNCFKEAGLFLTTKKGGKVPIRKVRLHQPSKNMILLPKQNNKAGVEPGNNHHIVLYRYQDSNKNWVQKGKVSTLFDVAKRLQKGLPLIN